MKLTSVVLLVLSLFVAPFAAEAQQTERVYRVGILMPGVRPAASVATTASVLPLMLRQLGYVEGRNLIIEQRLLTASSSGSPN